MDRSINDRIDDCATSPIHGRMDCYVYFKAETRHQADVILQAGQLVNQIRQQYAIQGSLQRRPETRAGLHTWMEVYRSVPDHFSELLQTAVDATELSSLIQGERHHEYFMDVSLCV